MDFPSVGMNFCTTKHSVPWWCSWGEETKNKYTSFDTTISLTISYRCDNRTLTNQWISRDVMAEIVYFALANVPHRTHKKKTILIVSIEFVLCSFRLELDGCYFSAKTLLMLILCSICECHCNSMDRTKRRRQSMLLSSFS